MGMETVVMGARTTCDGDVKTVKERQSINSCSGGDGVSFRR